MFLQIEWNATQDTHVWNLRVGVKRQLRDRQHPSLSRSDVFGLLGFAVSGLREVCGQSLGEGRVSKDAGRREEVETLEIVQDFGQDVAQVDLMVDLPGGVPGTRRPFSPLSGPFISRSLQKRSYE